MGRLRCPMCGNISQGDPDRLRCPRCGWTPGAVGPAAPPSAPPSPPTGESAGPRLARWAFACSLVPVAVVVIGWLLESLATGNEPGGEIIGGIGSLLLLAGPIAAIALGLAARRDPRTDQGGRNLALAAIIIGAITLGIYVVVLVFIILLVMACASACSSCSSAAPMATAAAGSLPCASMTTSAGRPPRRGQWREAFAHHPDLPSFKDDIVRVAGVPVCIGCLTVYPAFALAAVVVWLWPPSAMALWTAGPILASAQGLSALGWTARRWHKVAVKASFGTGAAFLLRAILDAPWPQELKAVAIAAAGLLALASTRPRLRRIEALVAQAPA